MKNFDFCKYTYIHRKIVMALVEKYITNKQDKIVMINRAELHDMDKMVAYLLYDKKTCSQLHRENSSHHLANDIDKTYFDYLEAVFDWESARYSKSDKPLNAYQTLYRHYPNYEDQILHILKEYGLDSENIEMDENILNLAKRLEDEVTEDDIIKEVQEYIQKITK